MRAGAPHWVAAFHLSHQKCKRRRCPASAYTLIFIFTCLHEVGAHWTYAKVPYDQWWQSMFGVTFNSLFGNTRNDFDRLVHFSYGLLLAYPLREIFLRLANVKGFWGYFLPLDFAMSTSMIYELIEWGTAQVVGSNEGNDFLGSQGDVWDSQKDMASASLGALIAIRSSARASSRGTISATFAHSEFAEEPEGFRRYPGRFRRGRGRRGSEMATPGR